MSLKKKEHFPGDHPIPDSTTKEKVSFSIGDEVLLQRKDGNFYLGTIVKIDFSQEQCQVKFGDNTETWSNFAKLTKLSTGLDVMCVKCKDFLIEVNNDIVICEKCSRGYHQKCHFPQISNLFLKEDAKWECSKCEDLPEKRSLPQRKSSTLYPQPTSLFENSLQSLTKPLPQTSKLIIHTIKSSSLPPSNELSQQFSGQQRLSPHSSNTSLLSKTFSPATHSNLLTSRVSEGSQLKPLGQSKNVAQLVKPHLNSPKSAVSLSKQPIDTANTKGIEFPKSSAITPPTQVVLPKPSIPPTPPSTPTDICCAVPMATEVQKKKLPYNLNDLHWDMHHRSNTENRYCYCGGQGKWFLKMIQCSRCRQWFHGRCLSTLQYPLFYGDRFYVFICTHCNSGKEFLRRLEIKWVDLVHLASFYLTLKTAKKYLAVDDILNFINWHWNELQLPPKILETSSDSEKREIVLSVLTSNRNRFKAAREVKSRKTKWGLRVRVPPPTPVFSLPPNKPLSDKVLSDAWNNSARLKFLPSPLRNLLLQKSEGDFDLSNLKDSLPGIDILHIDTRMLILPKGVPANGHNVCIKSSTPIYPESRAIKRRIKEQSLENDHLRRSRKARRLLRSSFTKEREKSGEKVSQELPPTPPSSESNPEAAPSAQPESSGDETSSRGTLDFIIPPPADFNGVNNPFLPLQPVLRPVKRKLSEKDIFVTSTGEVKRRKIRRSRLLATRVVPESAVGNRRKVRRLKSGDSEAHSVESSPKKSSPTLSLFTEELKSSVNQYFGAVNRINSGAEFVVLGKRVDVNGRTQFLINWGTPS